MKKVRAFRDSRPDLSQNLCFSHARMLRTVEASSVSSHSSTHLIQRSSWGRGSGWHQGGDWHEPGPTSGVCRSTPPAPPQGCKWYRHCLPQVKGFWHHTEKVHFPPEQHQQTHQLPGVIRQVWVATENFIFPLLATVAVHSPVAYEKKRS